MYIYLSRHVIYRGYIKCSKPHSNVMTLPVSALMAQVPIL